MSDFGAFRSAGLHMEGTVAQTVSESWRNTPPAPQHESACDRLSGKDVEAIAGHGITRTFRKGCVVISEGDEALALYILMSGRAKVYTTTDEGKEIILRLLEPGQYFGELTLLDGATRSASVMATEACSMLVLQKSKFTDCWLTRPELCLKLLKHLSGRVRELTEDLKRVGSMDVYQRLRGLLLDLATQHGKRLVVTQRLTQQDLGNRICASREMVSRIFRELAAGGYITLDGRQIVINRALPERW